MSRLSLADRREQLTDVAMQIALRDGVEAISTRAVAREAGVRPSVLHYCFTNKHELVAAMARLIAGTATAYLDAAIEAGHDAGSRLHALADGLWRTLEDREHYQLLLIEIATLGARDDGLHEVAVTQQREQWAASELYLRQTAALSGVRYRADVAQIARMVSAQIDGIQLAWMVDHDDAAAQRSFHATADVVMGYVEPVEPRAPGSAQGDAPR
jgi:AcrR family transcriptional regulator